MQDNATEFVDMILTILEKYGSVKEISDAEYNELVRATAAALDNLKQTNPSRE
jgi:hypothetical protein